MKKVLLIALSAALLMSCASKRAVMVNPTILEAKQLKILAEAQRIEVPATVDSLIAKAEKQNENRQTEEAFVLADEAILQLQLAMLKREQTELVTENSAAQASLGATTDALTITRSMLSASKNLPKEKVIK